MLAWDVSAEQEEPWRRVLQELSEAHRKEEEGYVGFRRRLQELPEARHEEEERI